MNEPYSLRSHGWGDEDGDSPLLRTVLFQIRLTAVERATLGQLASERGLAIAAFVRAAALGAQLPPRREPSPMVPPINRKAYWHLGQVSNNLDQMGRRLSLTEGNGALLANARQALEKLQALVREVRLLLIGWPKSESQ